MSKSLVSDRLNELYKKYFQESDYQMGQSFDNVKGNMTNEDYDLSQKLLSYYGQQNNLSDQYNFSNSTIESERKKALEENSIAKEKAMKYLPEYLKMQGLSGLGVSESSVIKAQNNFNNNKSAINSDANSKKAELLQNYQANVSNLDKSYLAEEGTIKDLYEEKFKMDSTDYLSILVTDVNSQVAKLADSNGKINESDKKTLMNILENNRHKLTETDQLALESTINSIPTKNDEDITSGSQVLTYEGKEYQITDKLDKNANEIKRNNDFKGQLKELGFTDPYDPKIPNGTTFKIHCDNRGSNDFNFWDDIGAFIFSPLGAGAWDSWGNSNVKYVTYYNGNWYESNEK